MKIIIAGDFCPRFRIESLIEENLFEHVFGKVKPIIESADYSLVNFECPVVNNPDAQPILKFGPNLRCNSKAVSAIRYAGFKGVTLANNHVLDFGTEGLQDTLNACNAQDLDVVGVGRNLKDADTTLYKKVGDVKLAFINCCENEFSVATDIKAGSNPLNPVQQFYAIKEARRQVDYVVVIVHGGHEHYQLPSPRMKELYRYFVDCGADVVLNHHQHCYSGFEVYKSKPIIYGLGNFCFDSDHNHSGIWTEGYMVELEFDFPKGINFRLIPYVQCADEPTLAPMMGEMMTQFNETIRELNDVINDEKLLSEYHKKWMNDTERGYKLLFTPYTNRYLKALVSRGLLPSFLSRSKIINFINYIKCESHRERIIDSLQNKI